MDDAARFHAEHGWVQLRGSLARLGISDFAQSQLGEVTYVGLPNEGSRVTAAEPYAEIESTKTVSDLVAPVSGVTLRKNEVVRERPSVVNEDAEGAGWLIEVEMTERSEWEQLMTADAYRQYLAEEAGGTK